MYAAKFNSFNISEVTYKVFDNQRINAYVLVPKNLTLPAGAKAPLLVTFHGGFFVTGAALDPGWFAQWVLDYGLLHSAIIVSAEYRLLPESNGLDILSDISDFWTWLHQSLNPHLSSIGSRVSGDLEKIIVQGGSAGGYLTIQSGLLQPVGSIKALIACYPGLGLEYKYEKPMLGLPTIPKEVLQNHLENMKSGAIVTSAMPSARLDIALSISQQGLKKRFFGTDDSLVIFKVLEKAASLPYTLILHGTEDSVLPLSGSKQFVEAVRGRFGEEKIDIVTQPGEHGFDDKVSLDMLWLNEALKKVTKLWLKNPNV